MLCDQLDEKVPLIVSTIFSDALTKLRLGGRAETASLAFRLVNDRNRTRRKVFTVPEGRQMGRQVSPKISEHTCPACKGTGFPVVMQPVQPGRKIYPVKCRSCDGKGKSTDTDVK